MSDLYKIVCGINSYSEEDCMAKDPDAADAINSFADLNYARYYLCYGNFYLHMPLTKVAINRIISQSVDNATEEELIDYYTIRSFDLWLDKTNRSKLLNYWLNDESKNTVRSEHITTWMCKNADDLGESINILDILEKVTNIYKSKKSQRVARQIGDLFVNLNSSKVEKGCEIVSKSTPAVSVNLLKRQDIPDKYILSGLRSLSKLSRQRDLDVKVDFKILEKLGPKGRLDAMKQLLGMFNTYYQRYKRHGDKGYYYGYTMSRARSQYNEIKDRVPFKNIPSKEEVEQFLFPCSLKYNEEVTNLVEKFEEFYNQPEEVK